MYITGIWETKCVHHVSLFPYDKPSFYCTTPVAKPYIIFSHPTNHQQKRGNCRFGNSQVVSFLSSFSIFSTGALGAKSVLSGAAPGLGGFDEIC